MELIPGEGQIDGHDRFIVPYGDGVPDTMKVVNVSICPTEAANSAGRPALTPELLAASGARYSRTNEGLEKILSRIDRDNIDRSVDGIFRMVDYGHQSIADMAPVAIFIDDLSIFLAYLVWSWCPTAGGQESSTRYIKLDRSGLVDSSLFGLPSDKRSEWYSFMDKCFETYGLALDFWQNVAVAHPESTLTPRTLLDDLSEKAQKKVSRMRRNFAFDRARYFLPVAAMTNMMLIMSSRGWVQLCQNLLSHWLPEANSLGTAICKELQLTTPRMVKHAQQTSSFVEGHRSEFECAIKTAKKLEEAPSGEAPCQSSIEISLPHGISEDNLVEALEHHDNRYAHIGSGACRASVRFSWTAVAIAEIRDLNRHRTGQKHCPLVPQGFYCAKDQLQEGSQLDDRFYELGDYSTKSCHSVLARGCPSYPAWALLGTQFRFEHTTTLDKFIYEAQLRTGPGAHFRYASHLRDAVTVLGLQYPKFATAIPLGVGEPE